MLAKNDNKKFKDLQTEKRIHEHLSNERDNISEEDINNVKTDVSEERSGASVYMEKEKLPGDEKSGTPENKKADDNEDPGIETPWNMLK